VAENAGFVLVTDVSTSIKIALVFATYFKVSSDCVVLDRFLPLAAFGSITSLQNILRYTKFVGRIGYFCSITFQKIFLWTSILFPPPGLLIVVDVLTLISNGRTVLRS